MSNKIECSIINIHHKMISNDWKIVPQTLSVIAFGPKCPPHLMLPALRKMPFILEAHFHYTNHGNYYYACKFHPQWSSDQIWNALKGADIRRLCRVRGDYLSEFNYIQRL
jgi:hypothetical protein